MNAFFTMILVPFRILRYYWKNYSLVALQMAAGAAVIYSSLTIYSSIQHRYDQMAQEIQEIEWNINASALREKQTIDPSSPLNYDQYQILKQDYPDARIPLHFIYQVYYPSEESELENAYFIFASDDFIQMYIAENATINNLDTGYIGGEIRQVLQQKVELLNINPNTPKFYLDGNKLTINESIYVPISPLEQLKAEQFTIKVVDFRNNNIKHILSDHLVLIPLKWMYIQENIDARDAFRLSVHLNKDLPSEKATELIMNMLSQLYSWNGSEYNYHMSTQIQRFLLNVQSVRSTALITAIVSILCLILVILGLAGLVHNLFNRRKVGLSILQALGAQKKQLLVGIMLEILYPTLLGSITGIVGSYCYLPSYVQIDQVIIRQSISIVGITLCIILIPIAIIVSSLYLRLKSLKLVEILNKG